MHSFRFIFLIVEVAILVWNSSSPLIHFCLLTHLDGERSTYSTRRLTELYSKIYLPYLFIYTKTLELAKRHFNMFPQKCRGVSHQTWLNRLSTTTQLPPCCLEDRVLLPSLACYPYLVRLIPQSGKHGCCPPLQTQRHPDRWKPALRVPSCSIARPWWMAASWERSGENKAPFCSFIVFLLFEFYPSPQSRTLQHLYFIK